MADKAKPKGPKGIRPAYKFTEGKRQAFLDALRRGARRGLAAEAAGVTRQLVCDYIERIPEFAKLVEKAELEANEPIEDALYQAALSGNVVALQVWLYNRMPDRWRDKRQVNAHLLGPDGGSLKAEITVRLVEAGG